ncbi:MAG: ABC-type multidrug transport system, ATPase component [halophilic archaeon J07HB67]|jgi:ABC-type multidrug transport system, ATPase component|nr:MAG: ABC-type multidrug transport system, ATPase component [halophilic archaeon J07HB67]
MAGIQLHEVNAGYRETRVLDSVDLSLDQGFNVVLGPNGCGKTTLFRVGVGILEPSAGEVLIGGENPHETPDTKREVSYLPHRPVLTNGLSIRENLELWGQMQNVPQERRDRRIDELADRFGFDDLLDREAGGLSRGQSQRASIGQALLTDPSVLFLDEATTGLDPIIAKDIREYLERLGRERTVVYSTHNLEEANQLADRLVVMRDGHVAFDEQIDTVRDQFLERPEVGVDVGDPERAREILSEMGYDPSRTDGYLTFEKQQDHEIGEIATELTNGGVDVRDIKTMSNTVESLYERVEVEQ